MAITRVSRPEDVDMGEPWERRLKYTDVAEVIADYEATNARIGRDQCPVLDYMRAHRSEPIEQVTGYVYAHKEWGPVVLCESMHRTLHFNNANVPDGEFVARWVQSFYASRLALHPAPNTRRAITDMLYHPEMRFVSHDALYVVLAQLNAGHPNPKRLLAKPEVRAKMPAWLDLTRFPCPDFPELTRVPLTGAATTLPPA